MKVISVCLLLVAVVFAELPPSNSYLPPSPSSQTGGYTQGPATGSNQNFTPQIVAARNLQGSRGPHAGHAHAAHDEHGSHTKAFGRSNHAALSRGHGVGSKPRLATDASSGYDVNAPNYARNALEEANAEPANYNFGYMVNDYQEGTDFGHHEARQEERAQGEYHVVLPDGRRQTVSYEADERGFKPQISYEESEDLARSGYDSNSNNHRNRGLGNFANHGDFANKGNFGHDNIAARSNGY